jgi:phage tail-like protein
VTEGLGGRFIIVTPDEPERIFEIASAIVRIGRLDQPENDIVLAHGWVSRHHARVYCDRTPYRIQDLGSSNGTNVNDAPLPPEEIRALQDGDVIAIGPFRLRFEAPKLAPPEREPERGAGEEIEGLGVQVARRRPPPVPPSAPPSTELGPQEPDRWVGIPERASRWLQYLPPIYAGATEWPDASGFLGRFLLIFEDLLGPSQQIITHFDLYLDPATAPEAFLPWLDQWLGELVDERWPVATKRELLKHASWLYRARGTRHALSRFLEICTGYQPEIQENADGPHTFRVRLHTEGAGIDRRTVERIIELNRPAHTSYILEID